MSSHESSDHVSIVDLARARRVRKPSTFFGPDWLEGAETDDRGRTLPILRNVMLALRSAPEIGESFAYDELERFVVVKRLLPLADGADDDAVHQDRGADEEEDAPVEARLDVVGERALEAEAVVVVTTTLPVVANPAGMPDSKSALNSTLPR